MCKQDQLKEEVATLKWQSSSIDDRCKKLETQKSKFKIDAAATKQLLEEQTEEITGLKYAYCASFPSPSTIPTKIQNMCLN